MWRPRLSILAALFSAFASEGPRPEPPPSLHALAALLADLRTSPQDEVLISNLVALGAMIGRAYAREPSHSWRCMGLMLAAELIPAYVEILRGLPERLTTADRRLHLDANDRCRDAAAELGGEASSALLYQT